MGPIRYCGLLIILIKIKTPLRNVNTSCATKMNALNNR